MVYVKNKIFNYNLLNSSETGLENCLIKMSFMKISHMRYFYENDTCNFYQDINLLFYRNSTVAHSYYIHSKLFHLFIYLFSLFNNKNITFFLIENFYIYSNILFFRLKNSKRNKDNL